MGQVQGHLLGRVGPFDARPRHWHLRGWNRTLPCAGDACHPEIPKEICTEINLGYRDQQQLTQKSLQTAKTQAFCGAESWGNVVSPAQSTRVGTRNVKIAADVQGTPGEGANECFHAVDVVGQLCRLTGFG